MGFRIKRVPLRARALPSGAPYRDAGGYPLEARRDELHVFVRRRAQPQLFIVGGGAVVATAVFVSGWLAGVLGTIVACWLAVGLFGERRIRLAHDVVELGAGLRPALHGALSAVRVRTTFHRAEGEAVERPTDHEVVVVTTRGERTIARFDQPADAHALAAAIDEHFGLVPPAEPLGAPDLDVPPNP